MLYREVVKVCVVMDVYGFLIIEINIGEFDVSVVVVWISWI